MSEGMRRGLYIVATNGLTAGVCGIEVHAHAYGWALTVALFQLFNELAILKSILRSK